MNTRLAQAYNILRRHANLFLNLLNLMRSSSIEVLKTDPETVIQKVRARARGGSAAGGCARCGGGASRQIQERFRLEVDDAKAEEVAARARAYAWRRRFSERACAGNNQTINCARARARRCSVRSSMSRSTRTCRV